MQIQDVLVNNPKLSYYNHNSIDNIELLYLSGSVDIEFIQSDDQFIIVMSDTQDGLDSIEVNKRQSILDITQKSNYNVTINTNIVNRWFGKTVYSNNTIISQSSNAKVKVVIALKTLPKVELSGSCSLLSNSIYQDEIDLKVSGSGDIKLSGKVIDSNLKVSGSGNINIKKLESNSIFAKVSGSGNIKCYANLSAIAKVSGSGNITIFGNPTNRDISKSGSGNIKFN